jgi:hypothetical protein
MRNKFGRGKLYRKRVTRAGFEKMLGGVWLVDKDDPCIHRNGHWVTWTGPSRLYQERPAKFVRANHGKALEGRTWTELSKMVSPAP